MNGFSKGFWTDESGAVTVDWTAVTAGVLLLGMAIVYTVFGGGVSGVVGAINGELGNAPAGVHPLPAPPSF